MRMTRALGLTVLAATAAIGLFTRGGVGVGTSEAKLRRTIGVARCRTEFRVRTCRIGQLLPGRRVTDFRIARGRVVRVTVGVVVD